MVMIRSAGTHLLYTCITTIMINIRINIWIIIMINIMIIMIIIMIIMINIMMMIIIGDHLNKSLDGFPALIALLSTDENPVGALKVLQSS